VVLARDGSPTASGSPVAADVTPLYDHGGVRTNAQAPPQAVTGCPQPHRGFADPIPSLLLWFPTARRVQSWGTVVQAFDETRPRPLRAAPALPSSSRVPPHNLEAEESLLGAMLLSTMLPR